MGVKSDRVTHEKSSLCISEEVSRKSSISLESRHAYASIATAGIGQVIVAPERANFKVT